VNASEVALLERYRPFVRYDSRETFRADSPAVMTDMVRHAERGSYCNILRRKSGEILAVSEPSLFAETHPKLNLDFLRHVGHGCYPSQATIDPSDRLDAHAPDFQGDARFMHSVPGLADKVHGRVVHEDGASYLQYWFFYYFNEMPFDQHEGDWEMIQVNLDEHGEPDSATYSQHRHGDTKDWKDVPKVKTPEGGVPLVYPAHGSHACYFSAGRHHSGLFDGIDTHDGGKGEPVRLDLVPLISEQRPAWLAWPGLWGATQGHFHLSSPTGPARQTSKWGKPHQFCEDGRKWVHTFLLPPEGVEEMVPPPAPAITVREEKNVLQVTYTFPAEIPAGARPAFLRVTVDMADGVPLTYPVPVAERSATIQLPEPAAREGMAVRVSALTQNGVESEISEPVRIQT
jgi:hypothetical protein